MDNKESLPLSSRLRSDSQSDVAERVLRRAEIAEMTRKLHGRLALASYKVQNGLNSLSFSHVEAHVRDLASRKRAASVQASYSDSSSASSENPFRSRTVHSPRNAGLIFSDDLTAISGERRLGGKRLFPASNLHSDMDLTSRKRLRIETTQASVHRGQRSSWKSAHHLAESSPIHRTDSWKYSTTHGPDLSFVSESSTIPDSPPLGPSSQEDHNNLPTHSFQASQGQFRGSPPRTPPPTRSQPSRARKDIGYEEGADLLLHLATSPSPANPGPKAHMLAPSTPPSNTPALPSSLMLTPGGGNMFNGFNTPGQGFNWADFVNVTPSPAQGAFGNRTPGLTKTPLAARDARRRLNFDTLAPPGQSPNPGTTARNSLSKATGLGMELGGELVSS